MANKKSELPFGWIVKQSKSYPDRIYYFNVNTGASTWEFPDLLQHYVSGKVESTSPPVLTATSLTAVSPEKSVQLPTELSQTRQQPCTNTVRKPVGSHTRGNLADSYNRKSSAELEPQFSPQPLSDNGSENMEKSFSDRLIAGSRKQNLPENFPKGHVNSRRSMPENISKAQIDCRQNLPKNISNAYKDRRQSLPENFSKAHFKSSTINDKLSDPAKSQNHSFGKERTAQKVLSGVYQRKVGSVEPEKFSAQKVLSGVYQRKLESVQPEKFTSHNVLSGVYQRKLESVEPKNFTKLDHKRGSNLKGMRRDSVHPYERKASQTGGNLPSKLHSSSDLKPDLAKDKDRKCKNKERSSKLSPIKYPKGSAEALKKTLSDIKSCVRSLEDSSKKVTKGTGDEINVGKLINDTCNEANSRSANDLRTKLKRRGVDNQGKSKCDAKSDNNIVSGSKSESKKSKVIPSSNGKDNDSKYRKLDVDRQTPGDKRRVVRSIQSQSTDNRSVSVQNKKIANFQTTQKALKSSPEFDLTVNTSTPLKSSCEIKHADEISDVGSDFDPNNNTEFKLFIGDKEKLLSIQSWINNLQEGAGSESPSVDSYSQVNQGLVNESVDSGYVSITNRPPSPSRRGWPGELKKSAVTLREVVAMEIDECFVSKETHGGDVTGGAGGDVVGGAGNDLAAGAGGDVVAGGGEEEYMDIDEVLVEVRQQVSLCGNQNVGSFVSLSDTDNATPLKRTYQTITVVVDTNILISNLELLDTLKDYQLPGSSVRPCLFIPWIVLRELDALKETVKPGKLNLSLATQKKARTGISFLKTLFSCKHPRVKGQTPKQAEEASHNFKSKCNDDVILQACLQCQKLGTCVVLLTNDNNLINKSLVSSVPAFNAKDIMSGLQVTANNISSISEQHTQVQCQTQASGPCQTPASGLCQNPARVQCQNPARVQCQTPASGLCRTPASVQYQTPSSGPCQTLAISVQKDSSVCKGKNVRQEVMPSSKLQQTCLADRILSEEKTSTIDTLVDDMYCKMKTVLHEALGKILEEEMQKAYDDIWKDIVYKKPPWGLKDVLECWKKHWIAVFGLVFPRHLSENIHQLLDHISSPKGVTVNVIFDICKESSEILEEASTRNVYGPRILEIKKTVLALKGLCYSIAQGEISAASVSSLEEYLQSQVGQSVLGGGLNQASVTVTSDNNTVTRNMSQCTSNTVISAINTLPYISSHQGRFSGGSENQTLLHSNSFQTVSSQNLPSASSMNPAVSQQCSDQTVINAGNQTSGAECSSSPESIAGERLSQIWKFIYKYCDEVYRTVSGNVGLDVLKNIEPVLKVLVSTSLELRKYYAGLLELPVPDLKNREEEFTALSHICNSFFTKLNVQEDVPIGLVTPLQLLIVYSKPEHRETLGNFLTQLDEMLKMMYQCLHKLCPDD
ncbi:uncharacterized protein LOC123554913 [Mercenaria mercenaria]|uniref:uncharacterized protein LOC123554913 n=1 Tax=Mercenaria mercenaria TaxID=6596 RepID=UPI00234E5D10|nr:uncharacterized protein LOC123554913 [Mercenaria mercenaria]